MNLLLLVFYYHRYLIQIKMGMRRRDLVKDLVRARDLGKERD